MDIQLYQYHPIIGYHFTPNLKTRLEHENGGYLVRVNSTGFRSEHEFTKEKEDKFRILLFGDSFTAADGVSNKHRYSDVLESLLPGVEVYNFALPGTGTDQHYLIYKEIAKSFEHDLIVIAVQVENIRRIVARHRESQSVSGENVLIAKPYFDLDSVGRLELKNTPVPKEPVKHERLSADESKYVDRGGPMPVLRNVINKMGGRVKDAALQISRYQPLPEYSDENSPEWLLMKAILRAWASEAEKPLIIMPIPIYHYVEELAPAKNYRERFAELKAIDNVTLQDNFDRYLTIPKKERRHFRFKTDIHPTTIHHKFIAESLAEIVQNFTNKSAEGASAK